MSQTDKNVPQSAFVPLQGREQFEGTKLADELRHEVMRQPEAERQSEASAFLTARRKESESYVCFCCD